MKKRYSAKQALKGNLELTDRMFRWLSMLISKPLARYTNITPNTVTVFSFIIALIAGYFFLTGNYTYMIIGGILTFFSQIFDQVDGEIARMRGLSSDFGKWLDSVTGYIRTEVVIVCLAIGVGTKLALALGMLAAIAYPMQYMFVYYYKCDIVKNFKPMRIGKSSKLDFLRYAYGSSFFYVSLPLCVFINKPLWALGFFAVFGNFFWVSTVFIQYLNIRAKN